MYNTKYKKNFIINDKLKYSSYFKNNSLFWENLIECQDIIQNSFEDLELNNTN